MDAKTVSTEAIDELAWDELAWEDWTPAAACALENGPDCTACEG